MNAVPHRLVEMNFPLCERGVHFHLVFTAELNFGKARDVVRRQVIWPVEDLNWFGDQ